MKSIYIFLVTYLFRNIPGSLGIKLRYLFYKPLFNSCGKNINIGIGVIINNFDLIKLGNHIRIDDYSIINVGNLNSKRYIKTKKNDIISNKKIKLYIKDYVHINQYCLISSFNYLEINNYCTFSSGVKIYNVSHHFRNHENKSEITYSNNLDKKKEIKTSLYVSEISLKKCFCKFKFKNIDGKLKEHFCLPNSIGLATLKRISYKENKVVGNKYLYSVLPIYNEILMTFKDY